MRSTTLFLLLLSLAAAASYFDTCEYDGVVDEAPNVCYLWGRQHVLTFDGEFFHPQFPGDYVLLTDAADFEVQGRFEGYECGDVFGCSKLTGLAVTFNGKNFAMFYTDATDKLGITVDGEVHRAGEYNIDGTDIRVSKRYPVGYYFNIRYVDSMVLGYFVPEGPVVAIVAGPTLFGKGVGVCGTFDGCNDNDLIQRQSGERVGYANAFESWIVFGGDSHFQNYWPEQFSTRAPFFNNLWVPYEMDGESHSSDCDRFVDGAVWEACEYELELTGDLSGFYTGLYSICMAVYETDIVNDALFTNPMHNCSTIFDMQMAGAEWSNFWNFHDRDMVKTAPYVAAKDSYAYFLPPMGGVYNFLVSSDDCCSSNETEISLVVLCEKAFSIAKMDPIVYELDEFDLPDIHLSARLLGVDQFYDDIHVSWLFTSCPTEYGSCSNIALYNRFSLKPNFFPDFPGEYTLEIVATDGCAFTKQSVNITINCFQRDYRWFSGYYDSSNEQWDEGRSCRWYDDEFNSLTVRMEQHCYKELPLRNFYYSDTLVWDEINGTPYTTRWNVITQQWELIYEFSKDPVYTAECDTKDSSTTTTVNAVVNLVPGINIPLYEFYDVDYEYPYDRTEIRYDYVEYLTVEDHSETSCNEEWYQYSHECTFDMDTSIPNNKEVDQEFSYSITPTPAPDAEVLTSAKLADWVKELSDTESVAKRALATNNDYFVIGQCEGLYDLTIVGKDDFTCAATSITFPFDVTCENPPHANLIYPCEDVYFDYAAREFPALYIPGIDSDIRFDRNYEWAWWLTSYEGTNLRLSAFDGMDTVNLPAQSRAFRDVSNTITMRITDGCSRSEASKSWKYLCMATVTAAMGINDTLITPQYQNFEYNKDKNYQWFIDWTASYVNVINDTYPENIRLNAAFSVQPSTGSGYVSTAKVVGDDYYFYEGVTLNKGFFAENTQSNNQWTVNMVVDDTCDDDTTTMTIGVVCPASLSVGVASYSTSYFYDPLTRSWPSVIFTDTSTSTLGMGTVPITRYEWRQGSTLLNSGSTSVSVNLPSKGVFEQYTHTAGDACMKSTISLPDVTVSCASNIVDAQLQILWGPTTIYKEDRDTSIVQLSAEGTTLGSVGGSTVPFNPNAGGDVHWRIVDSANAVLCDTKLASPCTLYLNYTGNERGWLKPAFIIPETYYIRSYTISVYTTDGCQEDTASVTIQTDCLWWPTAVAAALPNTVTFVNGEFPIICVNGGRSNWDNPDWDWRNFVYDWTFTDSPDESVFRVPTKYLTLSDEVSYSSKTEFETDDFDTHKTTRTETGYHREWTYRAYTTHLRIEDHPEYNLGGCFRPDLPGKYSLQLLIQHSADRFECYTDTVVMDVNANCGAALNPDIEEVTGITAGAARVNTLVTLIASSDDNNSPHTYDWEMTQVFDGTCADPTTSQDLTGELINRFAERVSWVTHDTAGTYCFKVTVDDECQTDSAVYELDVSCPNDPRVLGLDMKSSYTYDITGIGSAPVVLEIPPLATDPLDGRVNPVSFALQNFIPAKADEVDETDGVSRSGPYFLVASAVACILALL